MFLFRSSAEPKARPTTATEAGVNRVVSAIRSAAERTGAGFDYLLRTAQRESSLQPAAQAPTSSARGLYQFIDSTWLTVLRDEGRNLGLAQYAEQIGKASDGRPTVADATTRQQLLSLRDDPAVAALVAGAFTNRNAADLRSATGRNPTEGELYMAHFLGAGGASRLINLNETNPQASAARFFPDAAGANRRIFFDQGRPRTIAEVYAVLSSGQSAAAGVPATTAAAAVPASALAYASTTGTEADAVPTGWSSVPRVNADPGKPFHTLFAGNGGPINAFIAATWTAVGAGSASAAVTQPTTLASATTAPAAAPTAAPAAGTTARALGGPYYPVQLDPLRRGQPLDLSQFLNQTPRR